MAVVARSRCRSTWLMSTSGTPSDSSRRRQRVAQSMRAHRRQSSTRAGAADDVAEQVRAHGPNGCTQGQEDLAVPQSGRAVDEVGAHRGTDVDRQRHPLGATGLAADPDLAARQSMSPSSSRDTSIERKPSLASSISIA